MTITIEDIATVPEKRAAQRIRNTECTRIVAALQASPHGMVKVTAASVRAHDRIWKALFQFRKRHPETPFNLRKNGGDLFVWLDEQS